MDAISAEQDALYYPYVHFPNEAWLKATLLLTPHVYRMVAREYQPRSDTEFMYRARDAVTNGMPLLNDAEIYSNMALEAQQLFLRRLRADLDQKGPAFTDRFSKVAARALAISPEGFQMHSGKMNGELAYELRELRLAWTPDHPDDSQYVELHPAIGQAVLGAIAVACAADSGLSVIGDAEDQASRELNRLAPASDFDAVYDRFIHGKSLPRKPVGGSAEAAVDILLYKHCDASALTVEDLVDLSKEREPIQKLKARLQQAASSIPPMLNDSLRRKRLEGVVEAALEEWQRDRPSFRGAMDRFFGKDLLAAMADLAKGSFEKLADLKDSATSAGGVAGLAAASGHFLGPIAGFGVGIVVHGVNSAASELMRGRQSPYRFLSMSEKAGVVWSIGGEAEETGAAA